MNKDIHTVYSNIANLKLTPNEFVIEFGAQFPDGPPVPGTIVNFEPSTRIIMPAASLEGFSKALDQALKQRNELQKVLSSQVAAKA